MKLFSQTIVVDPKIRFGKPIVRGTRITVDEALGFLAAGMDFTEIEAEYGLTRLQQQAVIAYANAFLKDEELLSIDHTA